MIELPQTRRIHELVRALDVNPDDREASVELERLEQERSRLIEQMVQEQTIALGDLGERQVAAESRASFKSLRAQYRAACRIYAELQLLVARNRDLKKNLRDAL